MLLLPNRQKEYKMSLTPADLKKIAKKKGVKKVTSISSKEYRDMFLSKGSKSSKKAKREQKRFSFIYDAVKIERGEDKGYKITLTGKHYSKNVTNSFSRLEMIRYNKAISKAAEEFALLNRTFIKKIKPFPKAFVEYTFYNPRSRDHDNNSETIKHFQDTFPVLGFIIDDKREYLSHPKEVKEVLQKEYKAEALLFFVL